MMAAIEASMTMTETSVNPRNPLGRSTSPPPAWLALIALVLGCIVWSSWPALADMYQIWSDDPRYSHGFLVPMFALFLLWHRRGLLNQNGSTTSSWWFGVPLLLVGACLKLLGGLYFIVWLDGMSLLATLAGACVLLGGRSALRWAWPAIGFLFFMIPLPYLLENAIGPPLQRIATVVSTYILQTFGLPAQAEGNIINLEDVQIGVVEACNGLGMLMMFFAYATAVAIVIRRPLIDRIILVLSAAPIAMIANILRIATTGLLHAFSTRAIADHVYHDLAGWLMMPMALAMFGGELYILSSLFVNAELDGEPAASPNAKLTPTTNRPGFPLLIDIRSIPKNGDTTKPRR